MNGTSKECSRTLLLIIENPKPTEEVYGKSIQSSLPIISFVQDGFQALYRNWPVDRLTFPRFKPYSKHHALILEGLLESCVPRHFW